MSQDDIVIVPFTEAHLDGALRLSREAGWLHRRADWAMLAALSEGVVALKDGVVVATGFCTGFGACRWLNMVVVSAALRSQGLGRRVVRALLEIAGEAGTSLVATADGRPLYETLGFVAGARIVQHQGRVAGFPAAAEPVRPGTVVDLARICAWDRAATGCDRTGLLTRIAQQGRVLVAERGFAMLRAFGEGHVLGPVAAADPATACALVAAGARALGEGMGLRVDIWAGNGLADTLEEIGLPPVGGGTEMRRGAAPERGATYRSYALVSQALG